MERRIFCFWTGNNELSENRLRNLDNMSIISDISTVLITENNLNEWLIEPLHPGYKYLSFVHRADYLRCYFMHFYGGGYCDIKHPGRSWLKAFNDIEKNENIYINGYPEISRSYGCVPRIHYDPDIHIDENIDKLIHEDPGFRYLIGNSSYIARPKTDFTKEWYNNLLRLMDKKYNLLQKYPAKHPRDKYGVNGSQYPLRWPELLAEIFVPLIYKYHNHVMQTLPRINNQNYQ